MTGSEVRRQYLDRWLQAWQDEDFAVPPVPSAARRPHRPRPFGSPVVLPDELRQQLQALARAGSTPQALAFRCRLLLRAAAPDRPNNQQIAAELDCDRHTVGQWRERFVAAG